MVEAKESFNHNVAHIKLDDHKLINTGVYKFVRHPSYLGFYLWCLGTQLLLQNPICFISFAYVLNVFFSNRLFEEEEALIRFFGDDYIQYKTITPTYIPFIS